MIRDWKDSYRMLFVVACRIWDEDACKSWRNKFALDLEPRGRCLVSILVVQSCVRQFWCTRIQYVLTYKTSNLLQSVVQLNSLIDWQPHVIRRV